MTDSLAIIVPAYKTRYLPKALASIARQEMTHAHLYIFDDCSPEPVEQIVRATLASARISWSYERFDTNLGGTALTKHYDRCVARTHEDWIWLFSDDDIMADECVARFRETVARGDRCDIYDMDSVQIGPSDEPISLHPLLPDWESWKQHAYFIFSRSRFVPQQAVIFSRRAYQKLGGFVDFPLAWGSDFATTMALAMEKGIKRVPGATVYFRTSGENISSKEDGARSAMKLQAVMQFIRWFHDQLARVPDRDFSLSDDKLKRVAFDWLKLQLIAFHVWYSPRECVQTARFLQATCGEPYARALLRMVRLNLGMLAYSARRGVARMKG